VVGAAAWPLAARGQQQAVPVIGILGSASADGYASRMAVFTQGLKETGFIERQNLLIEQRWANEQYERLPDLAADLVRANVSLIITVGNNVPARVAKAATSIVPILFVMGSDPVALGLIASVNKPGGNITGINVVGGELTQKRVQLLHDLVPGAKRFGYLLNPDNPSNIAGVDSVRDVVRKFGGTVEIVYARDSSNFDAAFATFAERHVEAISISADALFVAERAQLVRVAASYSIPVIYGNAESVRTGGLMGYASNISEAFHQAGLYAGRILKGEKPADLPVVQPTRFEFVINLRTAKALGLTIPEVLLATADEVIQ
jgi:putative ABC transport system substrate-binding protein